MLTVGIIYIPLCFYFIAEPPPHRTDRGAIYIPLCFYFIHHRSAGCARRTPFTFHYASTLSRLPAACLPSREYLHSTMLLLYLILAVTVSVPIFHLHSTMLLLYQNVYLKIIVCIRYLHSTMLLLYPDTPKAKPVGFTNLHSTMLLLYLADRPGGRPDRDPIYIPLCFYFIK